MELKPFLLQFGRVLVVHMYALFGLAISAQAQSVQKTICSVTLNSDNEIKAFKSIFGNVNYKYVELVDPNEQDNHGSDWFGRACEKGIQCDALVISGHFAGSFFGSAPQRLDLSALEKYSCRPECNGIIKKPKEVYLFGCNTLAGKESDSRSPEEYRQVLIYDGFTALQAEQIASYRYSPLGTTNAARMQRVFSNANWIFGFNSISPSGQNVEKMLSRYLRYVRPNYSQLLTTSSKLSPQSFMENLKLTAATYLPGRSENIPACFLSEDGNVEQQLNWIGQSLGSARPLEYLPVI